MATLLPSGKEHSEVEEADGKLTGHAEIKDVFMIIGRGLALVLENGFTGTIQGLGVIRSARGMSPFAGPEFADERDASGAKTSWLVVIAEAANAADLFRPGDNITFSERL